MVNKRTVGNKRKQSKESQTHIRVYTKDREWFNRACKKHGLSSSDGFRILLRRRLKK